MQISEENKNPVSMNKHAIKIPFLKETKANYTCIYIGTGYRDLTFRHTMKPQLEVFSGIVNSLFCGAKKMDAEI